MDPVQPVVAMYLGVTLFLSLGFSVFLYLGYRLAPIAQHRLMLLVGLAFTVSAVAEFLDAYGFLQSTQSFIGGQLPIGFMISQSALVGASVVLFWYAYTTYYFIAKSSPEKKDR